MLVWNFLIKPRYWGLLLTHEYDIRTGIGAIRPGFTRGAKLGFAHDVAPVFAACLETVELPQWLSMATPL